MIKDPFWQHIRTLSWVRIPNNLLREAEAAHARRVIEIEERNVCINNCTVIDNGDCQYCEKQLYMRRFIDDPLMELGL